MRDISIIGAQDCIGNTLSIGDKVFYWHGSVRPESSTIVSVKKIVSRRSVYLLNLSNSNVVASDRMLLNENISDICVGDEIIYSNNLQVLFKAIVLKLHGESIDITTTHRYDNHRTWVPYEVNVTTHENRPIKIKDGKLSKLKLLC
jgi:hypothetical protein